MPRIETTLVLYSENRTLTALLKGVAVDSGMGFCEARSLLEVRCKLKECPPALLVIGVPEIHSEDLALVRDACAELGVPTILVVNKLGGTTSFEAIQSGAIACLPFEDAMQTLVFLVDNIVTAILPQASRCTRRTLVVSERATLTTPDYYLTNGEYHAHLPPVPGALLECLASRPNSLVPFDDLIRAAWGHVGAATMNVLHQQVHQVREKLADFGLADRLRCIRGRGYILSVPQDRS